MKTTFLSGILFLAALSACQPSSTTQSITTEGTNQTSSTSVVTLNAQEFATQSRTGTVLDVRTAGGAVEIDFYSSNFLDQVNQISKDQEVYVYCAVGARSEEAARMLIQQGYTKVYHLQGGIQGWAQQGLPVVR
jgi:rhodanese-related sulfurtransferase